MSELSYFPTIDSHDECEPTYAVRVENLTFGYTKKVPVLNNFGVSIIQGKIFALLGSNGCGKTTLLKLILGRVKADIGWIRVFGLEPGHKQLRIPGPGVGYMPQEIGLFNELTIKECLNYFGNIYKMNPKLIEERIKNLTELLDLPKKDKQISDLSGGQQRLVSLAVTIMHRPRLLILDEPTVGVDAILRCRIWSHLEKICDKYDVTVLITTHYIEEAKQASNVGFISHGSLLRQSNPHDLIKEFNCQTLEEAFLILCQQYYRRLRFTAEPINVKTDKTTESTDSWIDVQRIRALIVKNLIRLKRNYNTLLMYFLFPLLTLYVFNLTVGTIPRNIPIALYAGREESTVALSRLYLDSMDKSLFRPKYYESLSEAVDSVYKGKNMFAVTFPEHNYSVDLRARMPNPFHVSAQVLNNSNIRIYADHSSAINVIYVKYLYFAEGLIEYLRTIAVEMNLNPRSYSLPFSYDKPIFNGTFYKSETFPSPGVILMLVYLFAMVLSAFYIITDLKNKALERTYVSGIKPIEIFWVHMGLMIVLITIQVFLIMALIYYIFDLPIDSSIFQVYLLLLLQGIQGAGTGLLFALALQDEVYMFIIVVGIIFPLILCSGVIWPSEAIPLAYRQITDWTPITLPLDSLRSLLFRRLTLADARVVTGFIVCLIYNGFVFTGNLLLVTYFKDFDFQNFLRLVGFKFKF